MNRSMRRWFKYHGYKHQRLTSLGNLTKGYAKKMFHANNEPKLISKVDKSTRKNTAVLDGNCAEDIIDNIDTYKPVPFNWKHYFTNNISHKLNLKEFATFDKKCILYYQKYHDKSRYMLIVAAILFFGGLSVVFGAHLESIGALQLLSSSTATDQEKLQKIRLLANHEMYFNLLRDARALNYVKTVLLTTTNEKDFKLAVECLYFLSCAKNGGTRKYPFEDYDESVSPFLFKVMDSLSLEQLILLMKENYIADSPAHQEKLAAVAFAAFCHPENIPAFKSNLESLFLTTLDDELTLTQRGIDEDATLKSLEKPLVRLLLSFIPFYLRDSSTLQYLFQTLSREMMHLSTIDDSIQSLRDDAVISYFMRASHEVLGNPNLTILDCIKNVAEEPPLPNFILSMITSDQTYHFYNLLSTFAITSLFGWSFNMLRMGYKGRTNLITGSTFMVFNQFKYIAPIFFFELAFNLQLPKTYLNLQNESRWTSFGIFSVILSIEAFLMYYFWIRTPYLLFPFLYTYYISPFDLTTTSISRAGTGALYSSTNHSTVSNPFITKISYM